MYRLIWFQHVHKAAGSSIVNQAIANDEILYPNHDNGNPLTREGKIIPLWEYDSAQLVGFIDDCEAKGITFVATEWGAPLYEVLHHDPRVALVTCIREPWSRLVSNFNYDYYYGFSDSKTLTDFLSEELRIKQDNFLVRVFSRNYDALAVNLDETSLTEAVANLRLFDLVLVTERKGDLKSHLFEALSWQNKQVSPHATFGNPWTLKSLVSRLRLYTAMNYLLRRKIAVTEEERMQFMKSSKFDFNFYRITSENKLRGPLHPRNSKH